MVTEKLKSGAALSAPAEGAWLPGIDFVRENRDKRRARAVNRRVQETI